MTGPIFTALTKPMITKTFLSQLALFIISKVNTESDNRIMIEFFVLYNIIRSLVLILNVAYQAAKNAISRYCFLIENLNIYIYIYIY